QPPEKHHAPVAQQREPDLPRDAPAEHAPASRSVGAGQRPAEDRRLGCAGDEDGHDRAEQVVGDGQGHHQGQGGQRGGDVRPGQPSDVTQALDDVADHAGQVVEGEAPEDEEDKQRVSVAARQGLGDGAESGVSRSAAASPEASEIVLEVPTTASTLRRSPWPSATILATPVVSPSASTVKRKAEKLRSWARMPTADGPRATANSLAVTTDRTRVATEETLRTPADLTN